MKLPSAESNATINVRDDTGEVEWRPPNTDQNAARFMRRLHDGVDFPLAWRVIIAIAGVAPALLGITGIIMWFRRRTARRAIRRGHSATAPAS